MELGPESYYVWNVTRTRRIVCKRKSQDKRYKPAYLVFEIDKDQSPVGNKLEYATLGEAMTEAVNVAMLGSHQGWDAVNKD